MIIELLKRYHPDKKQGWLLYIEQVEKENNQFLKYLKKKLSKLPLGLYYRQGHLVGWHWYGSYKLFTGLLQGYKHTVRT